MDYKIQKEETVEWMVGMIKLVWEKEGWIKGPCPLVSGFLAQGVQGSESGQLMYSDAQVHVYFSPMSWTLGS